ncbi:MAG: HAD-IC family P-type ATPase [Microthrixaceae bacterium]
MRDAGSLELLNGLTAEEVKEKVVSGRVNHVPRDPMPSVARIIANNVLTPVNLIVGVMLVLVVVANGIGPDMLFGGVIVSNSVIGVIQELRARAALNRLSVLSAPHVWVRRDGVDSEIALEEIVEDDILILDTDGQVVVDGEVVDASGLELNESLLTGESDPVGKDTGDLVLSGSFVSAGRGAYRATRIGGDSYAATLASEARKFSLVDSELRQGVNQILKTLMAIIPIVAVLLLIRLMRTGQGWQDALSGVVAASVAMVPDGLVLLTSISFMAGVVTLAKRGALLRELAAVELLARVDTICLDKTGTITTGRMTVGRIEVIDPPDTSPMTEAEVLAALAAFAHSDPNPNSTQGAIADALMESPAWVVDDTVPFSSTRKWSAASFHGAPAGSHAATFVGAPEMLLDGVGGSEDRRGRLAGDVAEFASQGYRVLLFATATSLEGESLPPDLTPRALVLLEDEVRPDSRDTLEYFAAQGIGLKVVSGDNPLTVAAVARRAGIVGATDHPVDARTLPFDDRERLSDVVENNAVFGRVTPRQKREMMQSLQARGRKVAMTGDGVNDVLALKDADMGIAMGAGSSASRSVAELVLVDNRFDVLPGVLAEGRRVVNSIERAANLFVYGTVYSFLISLVIALAGTEFPFLPRHLTLVRTLTVGLPGFALALAPDSRVARPGFVKRVIRFCVPAGAIAAVATLVIWFYSRDRVELIEARTACTYVLMIVGLGILWRLAAALPPWRWVLKVSMATLMALALLIPFSRRFFELQSPPMSIWVVVALVGMAGWVLIRFIPVGVDSVTVDSNPVDDGRAK